MHDPSASIPIYPLEPMFPSAVAPGRNNMKSSGAVRKEGNRSETEELSERTREGRGTVNLGLDTELHPSQESPRSNSSDCLPLLAEAAGDHRDGRGFEILREPTPIGQFRSHRSLFGRTFQRQGGETKPLIEVLTEFFLQVFTTQVALGSLGLLLRPRQEPGGLGASIGGIAGGTVALLDPSQESPGYLADDS